MKTFLAEIIPKLQRFSQHLDNVTLLTNHPWIVIDDVSSIKLVYIFRSNNDLIISINGKVEKGKWSYLGNNYLLIERKEDSYLFRHGFFDDNVLALKVDGVDEYAFFVNENKFNDISTLNKVLESLKIKYLNEIEGNIQPLKRIAQGNEPFYPEDLRYSEIVEFVTPLFSNNYDIINIKFDDGLDGTINYSHYYEYYYIEYKLEKKTIIYKTKNDAILALRYYIVMKKIL